MNKYDLLLEAEKRGVLREDLKPLLEEAKRNRMSGTNSDTMSLTRVGKQAVTNFVPSAIQLGKDIAQPFIHPIETAESMGEIGKGLYSKAKGYAGVKQDPTQKKLDEAATDAVYEALKDRYGGIENIKRTVANDPAGALADVAGLISGGGGLLAKTGQVAKISNVERVGNALSKIGNTIDPLTVATKPVPAIAQSSVNALEAARNYVAPPPRELQSISRPAANRIVEAFKMSQTSPADLNARAMELGPRAMFADLDPTFTDVAEALNQQAGTARKDLSNAYTNRASSAEQTIKQSLDQNMGQPVNVPQALDQLQQRANAKAGPLYEKFHSMTVPSTNRIEGLINRIKQAQPSLLKEAERNAVLEGVDPRYLTSLRPDPMTPLTGQGSATKTRQWTGAELDYLKRAIDDIAYDALEKGDTATHGRYNNLARSLASAVDAAVSPKNPDQSIYAKARNISSGNLSGKAALNEGRQAFYRNLSADQLAMDQAGRTGLEKDAYQLGAREALRSKMDNAATNFRSKGDAAARNTLNSIENQRKLATIIGQQPTDYIMGTVRSENEFADNFNRVMGGSPTARREAIKDIIPRQYENTEMARLGNTSLGGIVQRSIATIANTLTAGKLNSRNSRIATDMARVLISQGADMQDVINGLTEVTKRQGLSKQRAKYVNDVVKKIQQYGKSPIYQTGRAERVVSEALRNFPVAEEENKNKDLASR